MTVEKTNASTERLRADPRSHAAALVESYGVELSLTLAKTYAELESTRSNEHYWQGVLSALLGH